LASILAVAASSASLSTGVTLLAAYSAGLDVPIIISTVAVEKFITAFKQIRRWILWINRTSATLLIIVRIMLLTGILTTFTGTLAGLGMPLIILLPGFGCLLARSHMSKLKTPIAWTGCPFIHVINICLAVLAGLLNVSVKKSVI
jgi:Cytochrome C biogenesis protein transmembrane region